MCGSEVMFLTWVITGVFPLRESSNGGEQTGGTGPVVVGILSCSPRVVDQSECQSSPPRGRLMRHQEEVQSYLGGGKAPELNFSGQWSRSKCFASPEKVHVTEDD